MADFLKVENILQELHLKDDMSGAEFGCGSAMFTIALARKLHKGKVWALDIQEEKLSALKGKLSLEKIDNVTTVLSDLEAEKGSGLHDNSLDVVLIPNLLFQAENKIAIIKEAIRVVKAGGHIVIVDWLKPSSLGPKEKIVSPEEIKNIAESFRLSLKKEFSAGDYHYVLIFTKV